MTEIFANSEDPDQMSHSVASDLGLQCLTVTLFGVSRLQWVKSLGYSLPIAQGNNCLGIF